jgi:hypothetical protein
MPRTKCSTTDLNGLRQQFDTGRKSQTGFTRLAQQLGSSAAALAPTHGVGPLARTLPLDYNKLKRQVSQASPSFLELAPRDVIFQAPAVYHRELSDPAGAKMTMKLPGDPATVAGLAAAFWRRA